MSGEQSRGGEADGSEERSDGPDGGDAPPGVHTRADGGVAGGGPAPPAAPGAPGEADNPVMTAFPGTLRQVLHLTEAPLFVVDDDGRIVVWNAGMTELTGNDEATARAADAVSTVFYSDGRRAQTLADKVLETHAGDRAAATPTHHEYDVAPVEWTDFPLYADESTFTDADGETRFIRFSAAPIYDDDALVGVVEYIQDRTEDVREQQALTNSMQEMSAEVGDMSASVEEVAATAQNVSETATEAVDEAERGNTAAMEAEQSMAEIEDSIETVTAAVGALEDQIGRIETVVDVIDEIADQTNLLALNASIEAANAGQAGDGFGVVADEVKQLATQSQEHADEIEELLRDVREETEATVDSLETAREAVGTGTTNVQTVQTSIDAALAEIDTTADGIEQVAAVTDGQATTAERLASMAEEVVEDTE